MYYESNLQRIKLYKESFAKLLEEKSEDYNDIQINVYSQTTRDGIGKTLVVEKDGKKVRLNSQYSPIVEAHRWADQYAVKNLDTVFVMFGLGNGVFVKEIAKKLKEGNQLIVYEPSLSVFQHVMQEYDLEDIIKDEKIAIIIKEINEYEYPYIVSALLDWMNLYSKIECLHPGYDKLFPEEYDFFQGLLKDNTYKNLISKNTYALMGTPVVENLFRNLPYIKDAIAVWDLNDKFDKDIPVIVVAAGPSLNKNINMLKEAKGRSIIIAVDRAYETLKANEVEPDFLVVLDALKELKYCGNEEFEIPLFCKLEASPHIMNAHKGRKIIYNCEEFVNKIYNKVGKTHVNILVGGSVTTAAFAIAATLGFKRIVFVGADMAYSGELSHAGAVQETSKRPKEEGGLYVEDIYGDKVKTRHDWYSFLRWFEAVIMQMEDYDVIDATEGGAKIKGTRIMTLKEVVELYCDKHIDCSALLLEVKPSFDREELHIIYEYLKTGQENLKEIRELSQEATQCIKDMVDQRERKSCKKTSDKAMARIKEINEIIQAMPINSVVDHYVLGKETSKVNELYFMTTDKDMDEYIAFKNSLHVYASILEACDFILPRISTTVDYFNEE